MSNGGISPAGGFGGAYKAGSMGRLGQTPNPDEKALRAKEKSTESQLKDIFGTVSGKGGDMIISVTKGKDGKSTASVIFGKGFSRELDQEAMIKAETVLVKNFSGLSLSGNATITANYTGDKLKLQIKPS